MSILESGSQEDTKGALLELQAKLGELGVGNRIVLGQTVDEQYEELMSPPEADEKGERPGWIFTGRNVTGWEIRRIPYLAGLRNQVMEPLTEMGGRKEGEGKRVFDRVLWINDVVFRVSGMTGHVMSRENES